MDNLWGHSITYRIAVGPQAGRNVFTLQTLPACDVEESFSGAIGQVTSFSLHAGVAARANEREKLERLCRYINRPAIPEKRLSLTTNGNIRYQLKTPYRDGTTHVIFEPSDFISGLRTGVEIIDQADIQIGNLVSVELPQLAASCRTLQKFVRNPSTDGCVP